MQQKKTDDIFVKIIKTIVNIIILNILWLVTSLPVITFGTASAAFYYAMIKVVRKNRGNLFIEYFSSFKSNFKHGAILTIIILVEGGLWYLLIKKILANGTGSFGGQVLLFSVILVGILVLFLIIYGFPTLSRFRYKIPGIITFSYYLATGFFLTTFLMLVLFAAFAAAIYFVNPLILILPGIYTYVATSKIERLMKGQMKKPEEGQPIKESEAWIWE